MDETAETTLRELGERGDIIKRIHRGLAERGIERAAASYVLAGESLDAPVIGRLVDRGLDDELKGTAYAVVDGVDGRIHHIKFPDLDATGDSAPGSIVELRTFDDAQGRRRVALAVRSDLAIEDQVTASGATWLDRQAVARDPVALGQAGFGAEVRDALDRRAEQLIEQGLAERQARGITFSHGLIGTLRHREVEALGERLAAETGQTFNQTASGEYVAGSYRQRFALASGRFAMIDDGLGFQLVPWTPPSKSSSAATSPASPAMMAVSTGASAATGGSACERTLASSISGKDGRHVGDEDFLGPGYHRLWDRPPDDLDRDGMDRLAARLPAELGRPWFELLHFPFYLPPAFFWWWYAYDAYAPSIFIEGAYIAASGGIIAAAVAIGMSVWRAREAKNAETYGSARWAQPKEIEEAGLLGPDGVVLGRYQRSYLRHDGPEHVLCFAPTRQRKGVGLVIPSL